MTAAGTSNALRATCSELDALSSSQHLTKLSLNYICSELEKNSYCICGNETDCDCGFALKLQAHVCG